MKIFVRSLVLGLSFVAVAGCASAQITAKDNDIPAKYDAPTAGFDYVKRVEMIPMRDGT
jgi:hypothetical protein